MFGWNGGCVLNLLAKKLLQRHGPYKIQRSVICSTYQKSLWYILKCLSPNISYPFLTYFDEYHFIKKIRYAMNEDTDYYQNKTKPIMIM